MVRRNRLNLEPITNVTCLTDFAAVEASRSAQLVARYPGARHYLLCLVHALLLVLAHQAGYHRAEASRSLLGDDLVPHPKWQHNQAFTILDTVAKVWPWLVQMGQGRGLFYSYEWLENIGGCKIHNADRTIPRFQNLEVGDSIRLH